MTHKHHNLSKNSVMKLLILELLHKHRPAPIAHLLALLLVGCSVLSQGIELKDIWTDYKFYATSGPSFQWTASESYLAQDQGLIVQKNIHSADAQVLLDLSALPDSLSLASFELSSSEQLLFLRFNPESLYRRSSKSYVGVYHLASQKLLYLSPSKVFNPSLSPDETHIGYTFQNNLYVASLSDATPTQLTHDGQWNHILNGRTDWVYEEEFGFSKAYQWIQGTAQIAYLKFNEAHVQTYQIQQWGNDLYPTTYSYKYPKAGQPNAQVSLQVVNYHTGATTPILQTDEHLEYIPKLIPSPHPYQIGFITLNRLQNELKLQFYNTQTNQTSTPYTEKSGCYVEVPSGPYFTPEGLIIDSYRSGNKHFHLVTHQKITDLTPGDFDVTGFGFYDPTHQCLYHTAYLHNSHTQTLCTSKKGKTKAWLQTDDWTDAEFSSQGNYIKVTTSNLHKPPTAVLMEVNSKKELLTLTKNQPVRQHLEALGLGKPQFFKVKNPQGIEIPCLKILPAHFDPKKKYPLIMHCYGGPGHQVVVNKWNSFDYFYHQMLAQRGAIIVLADGRGTDGNGTAYRQASYQNFGFYEHQDQLTVAQQLIAEGSVDTSRVGIWGWSFGGYLSSLCVLKSPEVFKTAIAVAPVTNWRFYDNVYTERYMGLPSQNPKGYDQNAPTHYAHQLKGHLLLIHGTADDNVHFQNSIALQSELLKHNKQFDTFYYADKNHGIYGGNTRLNLYEKMANFMTSNVILDGN